jgi:hypothetical protein
MSTMPVEYERRDAFSFSVVFGTCKSGTMNGTQDAEEKPSYLDAVDDDRVGKRRREETGQADSFSSGRSMRGRGRPAAPLQFCMIPGGGGCGAAPCDEAMASNPLLPSIPLLVLAAEGREPRPAVITSSHLCCAES